MYNSIICHLYIALCLNNAGYYCSETHLELFRINVISWSLLLNMFRTCPELVHVWPHVFFLKILFILFLDKGRERNINACLPLMCPLPGTQPVTQACTLTGNRTGNPWVHRLNCGSVHRDTTARAGSTFEAMPFSNSVMLNYSTISTFYSLVTEWITELPVCFCSFREHHSVLIIIW